MKNCNQCGKCCIKYSNAQLSAEAHEIKTWDAERPDIHQYVKDGEIWFDPQTGEQLSLCPFLRKEPNRNIYSCSIYLHRPDDCRYYPTNIEEMIRDECEMIEPLDLKNTKRAQRALDRIMIDSRPGFGSKN